MIGSSNCHLICMLGQKTIHTGIERVQLKPLKRRGGLWKVRQTGRLLLILMTRHDTKTNFTPNSSKQNDFFKQIRWYTFSPLPVGIILAYMDRFYCQNSDFNGKYACSGPNHTSKHQVPAFLCDQKLRLLKILQF